MKISNEIAERIRRRKHSRMMARCKKALSNTQQEGVLSLRFVVVPLDHHGTTWFYGPEHLAASVLDQENME